MSLEDIVGISLIVCGTIGFGTMFIIILLHAIGPKESARDNTKKAS